MWIVDQTGQPFEQPVLEDASRCRENFRFESSEVTPAEVGLHDSRDSGAVPRPNPGCTNSNFHACLVCREFGTSGALTFPLDANVPWHLTFMLRSGLGVGTQTENLVRCAPISTSRYRNWSPDRRTPAVAGRE